MVFDQRVSVTANMMQHMDGVWYHRKLIAPVWQRASLSLGLVFNLWHAYSCDISSKLCKAGFLRGIRSRRTGARGRNHTKNALVTTNFHCVASSHTHFVHSNTALSINYMCCSSIVKDVTPNATQRSLRLMDFFQILLFSSSSVGSCSGRLSSCSGIVVVPYWCHTIPLDCSGTSTEIHKKEYFMLLP